MYAINLPWEQSNDTLHWAIQERTHLRITVRLAREWTEVASQFLGGEMLKTLVLQKFATQWTDRMLSGQLLPCSFRKGHRKYLFVSAVIDSTRIEIDGSKMDAYVLSWPEGIQQVQRRLYFRAAIPSDMALSVRIWNSVAAIGHTLPTETPIDTGRLIDISAGGAQVEVNNPEKLIVDKSYLLEIGMPRPEAPIIVQAQARRNQTSPGSDHGRFGMQFLSLDHSPRGQETLLRLARFTNYLRSLQPMRHMSEPS